MRVCATYGSAVPLMEGAEMHEIRLDVFDEVHQPLEPVRDQRRVFPA